ncbi:MAG: cache domain-containing protein [Lachnospiraceae bacterium]|nr:cache domain-containing protein [Lachnospiraceae bacterium]
MERKGKIIRKIVMIAIAAMVVLAVSLTALGVFQIRDTVVAQIEQTLKVAAYQMEDELSNEYDGDWAYEGGVLSKGGVDWNEDKNVSLADELTEQFDSLKRVTELDYTLFYGDTRVLTTVFKAGTSDRAVGTPASSEVVATVLNGGADYMAKNIDIQGADFYGYYIPLKNDAGPAIGMIFVGTPSASVTAAVRKAIALMGGVAVVILLLVSGLALFVERRVGRVMQHLTETLQEVGKGNLAVDMEEDILARKDDLGIIADSTEGLIKELRQVIGDAHSLMGDVGNSSDELSDSAEQSSQASGQVSQAVDEISKGAVSQAESIQTAASDTNDMGKDIDGIMDSIEELTNQAEDMQSSCTSAMDALEKLMQQNEGVVASVNLIGDQIRATNDAVGKIAEASSVITAISEQTNLLSLNASIEAARAGEAGRGFAVVATEIGSLATQSGDAAVNIGQIVQNLVSESQKSVQKLDELNVAFAAQGEQLNSTKNDMERMAEGVKNVTDGTENIAGRVENLNEVKNGLVSIIDDLSAISEENAASTQETNASMQELNATFTVISNSAGELKNLADQLNEEMSFFKLD